MFACLPQSQPKTLLGPVLDKQIKQLSLGEPQPSETKVCGMATFKMPTQQQLRVAASKVRSPSILSSNGGAHDDNSTEDFEMTTLSFLGGKSEAHSGTVAYQSLEMMSQLAGELASVK